MIYHQQLLRVSNKAYHNLITNGNFSNGITGWTLTNVGTPTVANNEITFTATAQNGEITKKFQFTQNHIYYLAAYVKAASPLVGLRYAGATAQMHSGSGNYEHLSSVKTWGVATSTSFGIQVTDTRSSGWTQISAKYFVSIDLTAAFGAGNEPSKEWCDVYITTDWVKF